MQFAARQHWLEQVAGVHRAFGLSGSDDRVQFVNEEDDLPLGSGHILEHGLEPFFELSAVLCAGDQRAHVERNDPFILEAFGNVAAHDALRQSLDDGRFADTGIADEHRIVLGAAREHLDDAANFFVAANYWVEFAAFRLERQIASVALERFVGALGVLGRYSLIPAHVAQRLEQLVFRCAGISQETTGGARRLRHRQQHVFDRHIVVLQRLGLVLRGAHDPRQLRRKRHLRRVGVGAAQPRKLADRLVDPAGERFGVDAGLGQNIRSDAPLLLQQGRQHMLRRRLRVVFVQSARIGGVKRVANALRHLLYVHVSIIRQGKVAQQLQERPFDTS